MSPASFGYPINTPRCALRQALASSSSGDAAHQEV